MSFIICKHYEEIVEHVNPEQLLVQLKTRDSLTREEEYMLLNSNYTPQKRTKLLILQYIPRTQTIMWSYFMSV